MELPNPLGQGITSARRRNATRPVASLTAGFTVSAFLTFGAASVIGASFGLDRLPATARLLLAALLGVAMVTVDVISLRPPHFCRLTLQRQTPKGFERRYGPNLGPLMWGFDTGLAVTTIRVSAATWMLLPLTLLQVAPWWLGLVYAAGFCLPLAIATLLPPWRPAMTETSVGEPVWVQRVLMRLTPAIQVTCLTVLVTLTGTLGLATLG